MAKYFGKVNLLARKKQLGAQISMKLIYTNDQNCSLPKTGGSGVSGHFCHVTGVEAILTCSE